jgi:hypothetical protein
MDSMGRSVSSYPYLIVAVSFSVYSAKGDAPSDKAVMGEAGDPKVRLSRIIFSTL